MLLNLRIFKKLVKEAYNGGGLIVGREGEEYILCGGSWIIRIKEGAFEKEYKAAIIEHIGDLPKDGELKRRAKQYEIDNSEISGNKEILKLKETELAVDQAELTNVYIDIHGKLCRMVQCQHRNVLVNEELIALAEEIKEEGMEGPYSIPGKEFLLYWSNRWCKYAAYTIKVIEGEKAQSVLEQLRAVDLRR